MLDGDDADVVVGGDGGLALAAVQGDVGQPDGFADDRGPVLRADGLAAAAEVVVAAEGSDGHGVGQEEVPDAALLGLAGDADLPLPETAGRGHRCSTYCLATVTHAAAAAATTTTTTTTAAVAATTTTTTAAAAAAATTTTATTTTTTTTTTRLTILIRKSTTTYSYK